MGVLSRFKYFLIGILYVLILGTIFILIGLKGWQGEYGGCTPSNPCFCETIHVDAIIREPSQTWSNLALIFAGLVILLWIGSEKNQNIPQEQQNPMNQQSVYSILYGFLTFNIGIASFWFHASLLRYAEFMDTFAMNMYILFLLCYIIIRFAKKSEKLFLIVYIPLVCILGIAEWFINNGWISTYIFSIFAGIGMIIEIISLILMYKSKKYTNGISRNWKWFVAGIFSFFFSFLIWNLSLPDKILCYPDSWLQGHSFWHIGTALSTIFLYLYLRSEKRHFN